MTTYAVFKNQSKIASVEVPESYDDVWEFIGNEYPELYDLEMIEVTDHMVGFEIFNRGLAKEFAN